MPVLKTLAFVALSSVFGFLGLSLVFSDLGASESAASRVVVTTLFFLVCGLVIGFFHPKAWMMAGLCAWGSLLMGLLYTWSAISKYRSGIPDTRNPPFIVFALLVLLGPLCLSLAGGFVGRAVRRRRAKG